MTRILFLCGSQRPASLNAKLLSELARLAPASVIADHLKPSEVNLPLFDQSLETDPATLGRLRRLQARFAAADALVIASPEYNGLMTPFLKNTIDWVSRLPRLDPIACNAFLDRPVLLCSATPGWSGGGLGIAALRALFGHVGAVTFGETVCLPFAGEAWDSSGRLNPALPTDQWADCIQRFCRFAGARTAQKAAA